MPFVAGVIALVVALLMMSLALSFLAEERADQQAIADSSALAGANSLAKSNQMIKLIKFIIWVRNTVLNILYVATAIACAAAVLTLGAASPACAKLTAVTAEFQSTTEPAVKALEKTAKIIEEIAPFYAVANSVAYVVANNNLDVYDDYYGVAIPFPLSFSGGKDAPAGSSDANTKKIADKVNKLKQEAEVITQKIEKRKREIRGDPANAGKSPAEIIQLIKNDPYIKSLQNKLETKQKEIIALSKQYNKELSQSLEEEMKTNGSKAGSDGMVAVVFHRDNQVKFTSLFGGRQSGLNVAVGAAKSVEGDPKYTVGREAIKNLLSKIPLIGSFAGGALSWLMSAINIIGRDLNNLGSKFGGIGNFITDALDALGIIPPGITEERPALINVRSATKETFGGFQGFIDKFSELIVKAKSLESKFGKNILPNDL